MVQKDFKTLDEQIALLKSRGLNILNEDAAKLFLYHNNYYRISGYSLTLRKENVFSKRASFESKAAPNTDFSASVLWGGILSIIYIPPRFVSISL